MNTFTVKLIKTIQLTPRVRHFVFERTDGQKLDFIPGQFISIHLPAGEKIVRRSYSVASIPGSNYIEFAASYVDGGFASEILFNLEPGATLEFSGPYGRLILRDEAIERYFLVATGTGVTPYRAMLPALHQRFQNEPHLKIVLLLGVQYRPDQLYSEDFLQFAKEHPNFEFRIYFSRDTLEEKKSHEYSGHVQKAFDDLQIKPESDVVYLCGNPNMIDDAYGILKEAGFETQKVRREKYVS